MTALEALKIARETPGMYARPINWRSVHKGIRFGSCGDPRFFLHEWQRIPFTNTPLLKDGKVRASAQAYVPNIQPEDVLAEWEVITEEEL